MKQLSASLLFAFMALFVSAQNVPQGMNYQAVARNLAGEVLVEQPISLKINLYSGPQASPETYYSEVHNITSGKLGLINIIIGSGNTLKGDFNKIPWSNAQVWMEVSIKEKKQQEFTVVSSTRLLAVPYAFHAGTASVLIAGENSSGELSSNSQRTGLEEAKVDYWSTKGNAIHKSKKKLGSTDSTDLVLMTNSNERLRVTADGHVRVANLADNTPGSIKMVVADENGILLTQEIPATNNVATSNLQNVIEAGNTTEGSIVFKTNDNFLEIIPSNYDEDLKQGKFSMSIQEYPGVNDFDDRSNVVGSFWGYNTTAGGGQLIPGEASYRFAGETYYDVGGNKLMEFHLPEIYTNSGMDVRPFSMYIDRNTGIGAANFQMHEFNFKKVEDTNVDWMRLRNDAGTVRLEMQPEAGGSSYIELNGRADFGEGNSYNKAYIVNDGGGLGFSTSEGGFTFNTSTTIEGNLNAKGLFANNYDSGPGSIGHSLQGSSESNRILTIGDETNPEKFYITPSNVISGLSFMSLGDFAMGGSFRPYADGDLNFRFNTSGNNAKVNFTSDADNILAGQVSIDGIYAKSIQTEKPSDADSAGKLKIGSVINATVTAVTTKFLQIEIDGVNYKIPLMD